MGFSLSRSCLDCPIFRFHLVDISRGDLVDDLLRGLGEFQLERGRFRVKKAGVRTEYQLLRREMELFRDINQNIHSVQKGDIRVKIRVTLEPGEFAHIEAMQDKPGIRGFAGPGGQSGDIDRWDAEAGWLAAFIADPDGHQHG